MRRSDRHRGFPYRPSAPAGVLRQSLAAVVLVVLMAWGAGPARPADADPPAAVVSLPGGSLSGWLVEGPPAGEPARPTIHWQSPAFAGPFEVPVDQVGRISFPRPSGVPVPRGAGAWKLEMANGDLVVGRLESIDDGAVVMAIGPADALRRISVARASVRRISTGVAPSTFTWNGAIDDCLTSAASHWRERTGGLASTTPGAMLRIDAGEGDRLRYDLSLAWEEQPRVRLGFGEFRAPSRAGGEAPPIDAAYRIELTPEELIVVRDEARPDGTGSADLASCGGLPGKRLTLSVFIDRTAGRIVVVRPGETAPMADVTITPLPTDPAWVPGEWTITGDGLEIDVLAGAVVVERLRISSWAGGETLSEEDQPAAVELINGKVIEGPVTGMSDDRRTLMVAAAGAIETPIPLDTVAAIRFPVAAAPPVDGEHAAPRRVRVSDRHGSSLTGDLVGVAEGKVTIVHPAIDAPVSLPIGSLEGIGAVTVAIEHPPLPGRVGQLELTDGAHDGCLVPLPADPAGAGLGAVGWRPRGSLNAAAFAPGPDGNPPPARIRYGASLVEGEGDDVNGWIGVTIGEVDGVATITEVIPGGPLHRFGVFAPLQIRAVAPRGDGVFVPVARLPIDDVMALVQGRAGTEVQLQFVEGPLSIRRNLTLERGVHPIWGRDRQRLREVLRAQERLLDRATAKPKDEKGPKARRFLASVVLETGESVGGEVESIDEAGVRLLREEADPVTIPGSFVKAVELVSTSGMLISPEKFRSLTTLPRAQRHLPPTHLVRSLRGDYLRGRLEAMDRDTLRLLVDADPRGKPVSIPRSDVARVIWLHPESLDDAWQPATVPTPPGLPVESITGRDGRLRMAATGIEGNVLVGSHAILGTGRIDLDSIDWLLIGGALDESPRLPPYAQWQLQPAAEPRNLPGKKTPKP